MGWQVIYQKTTNIISRILHFKAVIFTYFTLAGGPRMDRRAVSTSGVVKISRFTSRLRRSARRGPDPTAVLIKLHLAKTAWWKTVTDILPRQRGEKPWLTRGAEWAFRCLDLVIRLFANIRKWLNNFPVSHGVACEMLKVTNIISLHISCSPAIVR